MRILSSWIPRNPRDRHRGQSIAEVALILPVFILIVMILFDFGRLVWAQQVLNQNARGAARLGSLSVGDLTDDAAWLDRYADIRVAARKAPMGVDIADSDIQGYPGSCALPLPPDPTDDVLDLTDDRCFYNPGYLGASFDPDDCIDDPTQCGVMVQITVTVPVLTPLISNIVGGTVTLTGSSEAQIQS